MARVAITESYLEEIANAIRNKTGGSATYLPSEMAQAILAISGSGGIIPTGTINITANGTYNVTNYASASVNVPVGEAINNQNKTVTPTTSQQSITADSGYTGLGTVTVNAMPSGTAGTPTANKGTVSNHSISITPSVTNTTGYITGSTKTGTAVTVSASELVSGNKSITSNGTNIDVINYATVSVNVSSGGTTINNQDKSVTPSESQQTITADDGYTGLGTVTIGAISSTYVGSGISQRTSSSLSVSGATVTVPAGYYASQATKSVSTLTLPTTTSSSSSGTNKASFTLTAGTKYLNIPTGYNSSAVYYTLTVASGSATGPSTVSSTGASISTGTNTLTLTKTGVSTTPTVSAGYVSSATSSTGTVTLTASVTTKAAATIMPGTTNQTIASGTYLTGTQTISGDANLVASNIKSGTSIFGVTGTYEGSGGEGGDTEGVQIGTKSATRISTTTLQFTGLSGQPTSFSIISDDDIATNSTPQVAAVSYDGTTCHGQTITNTNNAQVSYTSTALTQSYSNGTLTITASGAEFPNVSYNLVYTYDGSSSDVRTANVQVGSGATSITFTGLSGEPSYFSCIFKSNFNTSSGYQRVIAVANNGSSTYGLEMDSGAHAATHWSYTYNNGSLTINSQSTNAGGYFHQPGYYQLTYVIGGSSSSEQIEVMNIQAYHGMAYARATSMTATDVTLTVKTTGTYKVSWMGYRNTTSGTSGSQLYINGTAYRNSNTTFTSSYGQSVVLTGVSLTKDDVLVVRAQARSTSYYMYVGNLIIEQTA